MSTSPSQNALPVLSDPLRNAARHRTEGSVRDGDHGFSAGAVADNMPEAMRAPVYATMPTAESGLRAPADAYAVLGALAEATAALGQVAGQLAASWTGSCRRDGSAWTRTSPGGRATCSAQWPTRRRCSMRPGRWRIGCPRLWRPRQQAHYPEIRGAARLPVRLVRFPVTVPPQGGLVKGAAGTSERVVWTRIHRCRRHCHGPSSGRSEPFGLVGRRLSPSSPSQRRPYWSGMSLQPQ